MARPYRPKALPIRAIHACPEISGWLDRFRDRDRSLVAGMLLALRFVPHDDYAGWLRGEIDKIGSSGCIALYSVRKLPTNTSYWDKSGNPIVRPGQSQGSEDFVYSILSASVKGSKRSRFDHPGLSDLKKNKISTIVLVDDSIGSGDRISKFIAAMMMSKTFRSWWSYGLIRFKIVSYARNSSGEENILNAVCGSNHFVRKYPRKQKIAFSSEYLYSERAIENQWGEFYNEFCELCLKNENIPEGYRLGYDNVMSNLVFFHSVPNNIPGIFWCQNEKWTALFPGRSLPEWTIQYLLNNQPEQRADKEYFSLNVTSDAYRSIVLIKSGVKTFSGIAFRLNIDLKYAKSLVQRSIELGLVSADHRLTMAGESVIRGAQKKADVDGYDRSLYIPDTWCTD